MWYKLWMNILILFAVIWFSGGKHYHSVAGPYRLEIKRLESCPSQRDIESEVTVNFKEVHFSRNQLLTYDGNITTGIAIDNAIEGVLTLASWSTVSGWRENAQTVNFKRVCSALKEFMKSIWGGLMTSVFGEPVWCPYFPGFYRFHNWTVSMDDLPVKHFFYGKWRADLKVGYDMNTVLPRRKGCSRGYVDTVPA